MLGVAIRRIRRVRGVGDAGGEMGAVARLGGGCSSGVIRAWVGASVVRCCARWM